MLGMTSPAGPLVLHGTVRGVDGCTCRVEVNGLLLDGVRLRAVVDDADHLVLRPAVGSQVLLLDLSGGHKRHLLVLACSEVERVEMQMGRTTLRIDSAGVVINGGDLGGLVKIDQLTQKLNDLVNAYNAHTHTVATTGTAGAQNGTAAVTASTAQPFSSADYEDTNIKH